MQPSDETWLPEWSGKSLFLTANTTTPYTALWLDLSQGPVVLGPLDDAWFRWVVDVGLTGPDQGKGGKYLLLPPGYKGEIPEGYFVARSQTYGNLLFFRTFLKDGDPKPGVDSVKKLLKAYRLADVYFGPKAPAGLDHNWVQTIPGKGWNVLLRLYGPLDPCFDKTWKPGEFEEVK